MGTKETGEASKQYPLVFEITDGPSFSRIADSAKYFHDSTVEMPLTFTGIISDTRTGKKLKVKLKAEAYGFYSGNDHLRGGMTIFMSFTHYLIRGSSQISYNWRTRTSPDKLELAVKTK